MEGEYIFSFLVLNPKIKTMYKFFSLVLLCVTCFFGVNAQPLLFEDFSDFYSSESIPAEGWTEAKGSIDNLNIENSNWKGSGFGERQACFCFSEYNTEIQEHWLITPALDLTQNNGENVLSFDYRCTFSEPLGNDRIKLYVSIDNGETFTLLKEFAVYSQEMTKDVIWLKDYAAYKQVKFAFYAFDAANSDFDIEFLLDKVTVDVAPTADIALVPNSYNHRTTVDTTVFCGTDGRFSTVVTNLGRTSATATVKLLVNTAEVNSKSITVEPFKQVVVTFDKWVAPENEGTYKVNVLAECNEEENIDNNSGEFNVMVYKPYTTLNENFDSSSEFPANWSTFIKSSGSSSHVSVKNYYKAHSEPNCVEIKDDDTYVSKLKLVTPGMKLDKGAKYRASFWMNGSSSSSSLNVYQTTNPYDFSLLNKITTVNLQDSYTNQLCEFEFLAADITYLVLSYNSAGKYVYVDDFSIEKVKDYELALQCIEIPENIPAGLAAAAKFEVYNKGAKTANVKINIPKSENIDYSVLDEDGKTPIETKALASGEKGIISLKLSTKEIELAAIIESFELQIAENTHPEITASVTNTVNIYKPFGLINEDFEGVEQPMYWNRDEGTETNMVRFFKYESYAHSGERYVQLGNSGTEGARARLITPLLEEGAIYQVTFFANGNGTLVIGTLTDPSNPETYVEVQKIEISDEYTLYNLPVEALSDAKAVVLENLVDGSYGKVVIDDVVIEKLPAVAPQINMLSKQISAYEGADEYVLVELVNMGYKDVTYATKLEGEWEYSLFSKDGLEEISTIEIPAYSADTIMVRYNVGALSATEKTEKLKVAVRYTEAGIEKSFSMELALNAYKPFMSYVNDFEESVDFPMYCGANSYDFNGVSLIDYNAYSGDKCIKLRKSNSSKEDITFVLPAFKDNGIGYNVSFYAFGSENAKIVLGAMTQNKVFEKFEALNEVEVTDEYTRYSLKFEPEETAYLAFQNNLAGTTFYLDSLVVEPAPVNVTIKPTNEQADVNVDIHPVITFTKPIRLSNDQEVTISDIDKYIELRRGDSEGELVDFSATISADFKKIEIAPTKSLDDNQSYVLIVLQGLEDYDDNQIAQQQTFFVTEDNSVPTFVSGYPKLLKVTKSYADIQIRANEDAMVYSMVLPNGVEAPSALQVVAGVGYDGIEVVNAQSIPVKGNEEIVFTILGLTENSEFDIYLALEDKSANENLNSEVVLVDISTPDETAPTWIEGYPAVNSVSPNTVALQVEVNEQAEIYFAIQRAEEDALTIDQVIDKEADISGSIVAIANEVTEKIIKELSSDTQYKVYFVAVDNAQNRSESITILDFKTKQEESTGVDDISTSFCIWPNPVSNGFFSLKTEHSAKIVIYDLKGCKLLEDFVADKEQIVDVSSLSKGMYVVAIEMNDDVITHKLIIK